MKTCYAIEKETSTKEAACLDALVTMFPNAYKDSPVNFRIADVLRDIRSGRFESQVARLHRLRASDSDAYDRDKKKLPAFCMSGTAANRKKPLAHSGLLQIDLDKLGGSLSAVREKVRQDPHVAFGFVSPSGDGLKLGLRIDGDRHAESFAAAQSYFQDHYGLPIDKAVKDRLRLCFVSHDPDLWENPDAVVFRVDSQHAHAAATPLPLLSLCRSVNSAALLLCNISEDEVVRKCVAADVHQSHKRLFDLARGVKMLERDCGELSESDLERVFGKWHRISLPHLRPDRTRDKYFAEFLEACDCAEHPLDENALTLAWSMARTAPAPKVATKFKSAAARMLVSLCYQLQQLAGDKEFFLSCRSAAQLLEVSHVQAARFLRLLARKGVLVVIEAGSPNTNRATRYRLKGITV